MEHITYVCGAQNVTTWATVKHSKGLACMHTLWAFAHLGGSMKNFSMVKYR